MAKKLWKEIKVGDVFKDGSVVKSIHESYLDDCYLLEYRKRHFLYEKRKCMLSQFHLLLCDIKHCDAEIKQWVDKNFGNYSIPTLYDKHLYFENLADYLENHPTIVDIQSLVNDALESEDEAVESDLSKVDENLYWLPVSTIFILVRKFKQKIYCNNNIITNVEYRGKMEVFCVETDSHRFETCGLIHHNSVTLRNIIFHCLTHGEQIAIALIDLKYTEFTYFKGVKNVVAVANTVRETAEIMRIARECMYKRNQELSKLGLTDIKDFKPQKPTDEVIVAGRKLKDSETVEIRLPNGEEKTVTVKELEQYL